MFVLAFALFVHLIGFCTQRPDHTKVPGAVICYSPAKSKEYIGSPSIVRLDNGHYVASHDYFGPGSGYNKTHIHISNDRGKTWQLLSTLEGQFWSSLFTLQDRLYILGTSRENGYVVIRRSIDGGRSWTKPVDEYSGLLFSDGEYHCAPVPVVLYNGRIWRAMEDRNPPEKWGVNFRAFVMSANANSDLLQAASWRASNRLRYNQDWPGSAWLEGNIVINPDGAIYNILRNHTETGGKAALIHVADDGNSIRFDPETGFIDFPGGSKKFAIRCDSLSGMYWSLTNYIRDKGHNPERTRNTLALISSTDLKQWNVRSILLYHPDVVNTGFQYADWQFEGDDLIAAVRTAYDDGMGGANNCHDANYLTFHRIADFRQSPEE